jgi:ABC-2 type transport system permease protein
VADGAFAAYGRLLAAQARSQSQYRASFAMELIGSAVFGAVDLLSVLILFRVSRTIGGFEFAAAFLMASFAACGFSIADLLISNIERIRVYVRTGLLDTVLIRPLGVLPQLLTGDIGLRRIGRFVVSTAVLAVAVHRAGIDWTPARVVLFVLTPVAGAVLFGAIFVASATVAFWWIDSGEFANAVTYGGREFTSYPIPVFTNALFRRVFAYGLGFAFVGYYPSLVLLGRSDPLGLPTWIGWLSPVVALVAASLAGLLWRVAIRHYRSTGS